MPSPFPGMNPYLEREGMWDSFHPDFINACKRLIVPQVRPNYIVTTETRLYLQDPPDDARFFGVADVGVVGPGGRVASGSVAVAPAPAYVTLPEPIHAERVRYLAIRTRHGRDVVTAIELLSPTNKYAGDGREQYLLKRGEVLRSRTHLIEIDLMRGGPRLPAVTLPPCDYCGVVSRVEERPRAGVWAWHVRDPLPKIPVPLRADDPDAVLDLKAALDIVYDDGGYADYLYAGPPEPRLAPDDAAWAAAFVPAPPA